LIEETALSAATHRALFDKFVFCLPPGEQMQGYPVAGAATARDPASAATNWVWYRPAAEQSVLADLLTDEAGRRHDVSIAPPLIRREIVARMRAEADALLAPQVAEMVHLTPQPFFHHRSTTSNHLSSHSIASR
jgi:hypothetical protein